MENVIIFVRVNKNNMEYSQTQLEVITQYVKQNNIKVETIKEIEVNTPKEESNILTLLDSCVKGCTILVYDLNVFGRTIAAILDMLKKLLQSGVRIISVTQKLDLVGGNDTLTKVILSVISMSIDLEKELMSLRTKEALTAKKLDGVNLGKPKGTIQKSKFDEKREKIEELLAMGLSVRKIAKLLGYNNHIGLNNYVKKRNIREKLEQRAS
jgi:DNA invertase Pin-like site-specific DNA recombinase